MRIINSIPKERIDEVLTFNKYFTHLMGEEYFNSYIVSNTDFDISFALLNENDEIVGVYLLNKSKIDNYVTDSTKFNGLKGAEGVLLCIQEDYRNHGWGNKLKDAPKVKLEKPTPTKSVAPPIKVNIPKLKEKEKPRDKEREREKEIRRQKEKERNKIKMTM